MSLYGAKRQPLNEVFKFGHSLHMSEAVPKLFLTLNLCG